MPLGSCAITKLNLVKAAQAKQKRIIAAYERAKDVGEQSMQANTPELTGALKASSKAERLPTGIGFEMRSYGNEAEGRAYASHVNNGHFVRRADGSTVFVPPQPYFSQAVADAQTALSEELRKV